MVTVDTPGEFGPGNVDVALVEDEVMPNEDVELGRAV